jgi:hypothetical protein
MRMCLIHIKFERTTILTAQADVKNESSPYNKRKWVVEV